MEIKDIEKVAKLCKQVHFRHKDNPKEGFFYIKKADTEVLIKKDGNDIYVAFNGTELEVFDIVPHFLRRSIDVPLFGKVHQGYFLKLMIVYYKLINTLLELTWNTTVKCNLYVVGHSMGGALAQLFALSMYNRTPLKRFCMSSGESSGESSGDLYERGDIKRPLECTPVFSNVQAITFGSCKPIKEIHHFASKPIIRNFYVEEDYVGLFPYGYECCGDIYVIPKRAQIVMERLFDKEKFDILKVIASMFMTKRHGIDYYIEQIKKCS